MNLFQGFFVNNIVNKSINATFIVLIPKNSKPKKVSECRPINLTTSIYKVVAKVLAERLKTVLPSTIVVNQATFIKGRQITDPILIANEIVDFWRCTKKQGVIFKLDIEKAFDKINWDFLLSILALKGFPDKWINWIRACISSATYSVLINGKPRGYIQASRYIRQDDPLSPFLFVIAMDYLSRLIEKAQQESPIRGFIGQYKEVHVSYLLFADDILLFSKANPAALKNMFLVIKTFEAGSGLKIKLQKSSFVGINIIEQTVNEIELIWGCQSSSLPMSYLGVPLGGKPSLPSFWEPIIEKIKKEVHVMETLLYIQR